MASYHSSMETYVRRTRRSVPTVPGLGRRRSVMRRFWPAGGLYLSIGVTTACRGLVTTATLPEGQDPAGLAQHRGPAALSATLDSATTPLADLVVDERLAPWSDRLHWVEGQLGAARDAAGLIATFPPDQIGRQVLRVADRLGLDPADLTRAVADAISRDGDALGRLGRRDRRDDLDRDSVTTPTTAAQLARTGYPAPLRAVAPAPGAAADVHTGAARTVLA